MNPQAKELNEIIEKENPSTYALLSQRGKNLFFPAKGIMAQAAEAKKAANPELNATIGIAKDSSGPLGFQSLRKFLSHDLSSNEIFNYSSSYGSPELRQLWRDRLIELNPLLKNKGFSLPLVTSGLSHGLYLACQLFLDNDGSILLPDQIWGNYRLMIQVNHKAKIQYYPFFNGQSFHQAAFEKALTDEAERCGQLRLILNFPNNPTGYSPRIAEAKAIIKTIEKLANNGIQQLIILDEAYFGLFYDNDIYKHSLFSELADIHENVTAIKICGSTKEFFAWGFRVGFITFASKNASPAFYEALVKKAAGNLRASISNCSTMAQSMLAKTLSDRSYIEDFKKNYKILEQRLKEVQRVLQNEGYKKFFIPYPYNSGYFMLVRLQGSLDAETIRKTLLEKYKVGVIATAEKDIRIAFSCIEKANIQRVFECLYQACQQLS